MRHLVKGKKLNRNTGHRQSLLKNLLQNLILKEKLVTTSAKADLVVKHFEKMLNKAKKADLHTRRQLITSMFSKQAANKMIDDIIKRYQDQKSGFVKCARLGRRRGDNSFMIKLSLKQLELKQEDKQQVKEVKEVKKKK